jgi:hypothetical protein
LGNGRVDHRSDDCGFPATLRAQKGKGSKSSDFYVRETAGKPTATGQNEPQGHPPRNQLSAELWARPWTPASPHNRALIAGSRIGRLAVSRGGVADFACSRDFVDEGLAKSIQACSWIPPTAQNPYGLIPTAPPPRSNLRGREQMAREMR